MRYYKYHNVTEAIRVPLQQFRLNQCGVPGYGEKIDGDARAFGDCSRNYLVTRGKRAGEGNRTPVCSLGSCRSTIELHPRGELRVYSGEVRNRNYCQEITSSSLVPVFLSGAGPGIAPIADLFRMTTQSHRRSRLQQIRHAEVYGVGEPNCHSWYPCARRTVFPMDHNIAVDLADSGPWSG